MQNTRWNYSIRKQVIRSWSIIQILYAMQQKVLENHTYLHITWQASCLSISRCRRECHWRGSVRCSWNIPLQWRSQRFREQECWYCSYQRNIYIGSLLRNYRQSKWLRHVRPLLHKKRMLCQSTSQIKIHPREITFLRPWRQWFCILLSFRKWLERTEKLQSNDITEVDWSNGTNDF